MSELRPLLVQTAGGFSLRYGERWLYSRYQPEGVAEKTVLDIPVEPDTLYLLISPCLCHGLPLLAGKLHPSCAVFGIELNSSLLTVAKESFAQLKLDPHRFRLCTSTSLGTILSEVAESGKFRRVKEVRLSGGRDLYPGEYDRLVDTITINNRLSWRNRMTLVRLGRLWVNNIIANLATLPWEQITLPKAIHKPVMLCGAGPSLNQALPWIRKNSSYLSIMAVDTAAGALAQAGIQPDYVICLEAQAHNLPDFTPLTGLRFTLVSDISAHPASFRLVKGPINLVSSQWMKNQFLKRLSNASLPIHAVPPLGSVGVLAAKIAVDQGQHIFLAGLDFSFLPGITHCTGSPSDLAERRLETRLYKQNRNWALSWGHGVYPTVGGSLGNAILSMYASCAGIELEGASVYDLRGGFGLPLPSRAISYEQADELLGSGLYSVAASISTVTTETINYRTAATAFLENELALARELAGKLRSGSSHQLEKMIADCDYMYGHFPDPERVEAMEIDALKRLALEAGYWQNRLQTALEGIRT